MRNALPAVAGPQGPAVLNGLLSAAQKLAAERGLAGLVAPFLPAEVAMSAAEAVPGAVAVAHNAEAVIDVPPGGLAELMSRARKRDRENRKAEQAAFARAGGHTEVAPVTTEVLEQAAPLIAQTRARYGNGEGTQWVRDQLLAQQRCGLLQDAVAFLSRCGGAVTTVTICFVRGGSMHARYFGADYARDRAPFDYFVTAYYNPVDYAAMRGLRWYALSTSALDAKVRRGARLAPLLAVVLLAGGVEPPARAVAAHNAAFGQQFHERCRSRPEALGLEWSWLL